MLNAWNGKTIDMPASSIISFSLYLSMSDKYMYEHAMVYLLDCH